MQPPPLARVPGLYRSIKPTLGYLSETEVHVFSFSIAANVLLSFYPFMLVMIALCRHVLHWPAAEQAIYVAVKDYFQGATGEFLAYNLPVNASQTRSFEWVSVLLLLFTANGIFMPLEVALNRAFGVKANRSFLMNQVVSSGLIFGCGALALFSTAFTAVNQQMISAVYGLGSEALGWVGRIVFRAASIPVTIFILFLIYWKLPNCSTPARLILPGAVRTGLALEVLKWTSLLVWEWLFHKFEREYGVFRHSITIMTWSFLAGMVVLAGAEWTARMAREATSGGGNQDRIP
jgi:YihY family inner membrane protein